jgi:MtrB/PioB family decaheme-associated outer membrane protein
MRNRLTILTAALVLTSAVMARAQQKPADGPTGSIEVGARVTSTSGDEARYERYRDLRNGVPTSLTWGRETATYLFGVKAENIGYRDQNYEASFANSRIRASFTFDATPLNYSYDSVTPWVEQGKGTWTLDTASRVAVQNKTAVGILCAPGLAAGATCSSPTTAGLALSQVSIFRALAVPFDLTQRRDTLGFGVEYAATREFSVDAAFQTVKKTGYQPWGASFAFNVANELPAPLDQRTNDVTVGLEWANRHGMVRVSYLYSAFKNPVKSLVWDNAVRATDTTPYDASGYSNGNGPAKGLMALWPNSHMNVITAQGVYKMAPRTTLSGSLSLTSMKQNDVLNAWTLNSAINTTAVWAQFPALQKLPRTTAEAEVRGVNAVLNFTSRPNKYVSFNARYRYNDHENKTPAFDAIEYVRFDAVPEETGGESEQFSIKRDTLDLSTTLNLPRMSALKLQYVLDNVVRSSRSFSDMTDRTLRASYDLLGTQYFTVRAVYERTQRRGSGFSQDAIEEGGAQADLRFYDEADRTRNRGTLLVMVTPVSAVNLNLSVASGKDVYNGEGHEFGLLNNKNTVVTVGADVTPNDKITFGASYGRDTYNAFQQSRNANPLSGVAGAYESWTDPNRTWNLTNDEKVNNFDAYVDLPKAISKTDLRFAYTYSNSDNAFVHGGPRIQELATNTVLTAGDTTPCTGGVSSCFIALPNVTNTWQRLTADASVEATAKVGIGVSVWYEKLDITDFATINQPATNTPRIDYLGSLTTGYGNRPYKGVTAVFRVNYKF